MDNNEVKEEKKKKFNVLDIFRNKRYYAIANLSFWSVIIIILSICVRVSEPQSEINSPNTGQTQIQTIEGFEKIKKKNFRFKYSLLLSNNSYVFEGKQSNDKILFNDVKNNKEYFIKNDVVLVKNNNNYILDKTPVKYFNYIDVELIEKILLSSQLEDTKYIISCNDFSKIIMNDNIFEDKHIYITLIRTTGIITKIQMDLGEYVNSIDSNVKSAKLDLEYYDFDLVEDFDITNK